ncbi:DUF411 domain-containing protein [Aquabacterium sp. J223]|uniref:DUF411 domain-containing protein n=1 Tax=Aquabacterium sp. J223 TaxID=2898431 RepID=UPI0021AE1347|nr:DUF411 domain-containing protein [Aquabacterium sp. J223]UUX96667.1 DUF411 domain-containing protein [Aquabacterium sp. J223]
MSRRRALGSVFGAAALLLVPAFLKAQQRPAVLAEVWKSPTCGCCKEWVTHLEASGFRVKVHDVGNTAMRAKLRIPARLGSCHTALVAGYAIEGHVPAQHVLRLLRERPRAVGLAVAGMPVGSPGMDGPDYGDSRDPYDVLLVTADGGTRVFSSYFK